MNEIDDVPAYIRKGRHLPLSSWERHHISGIGDVQFAPEAEQAVKDFGGPYLPSTRWQQEAPTKPGWYFNRQLSYAAHGDEPVVVLLVFEREGFFYALDPSGRHYRDVRTMLCQWAGPIPEPIN